MKKSTLKKALRELAKPRKQRDISKAINRNNYWLWKQTEENRLLFNHLKEICEEVNAEIVIRSNSGRKLTRVLGVDHNLESILELTTKDQRQISQLIKAHNKHLWKGIKLETVRINFIFQILDVIDAEMVIRSKDFEKDGMIFIIKTK